MRKLIALLVVGLPAIVLGLVPQQKTEAMRCTIPDSASLEIDRHADQHDERIYHVWCGGAL